MNKRYPVIISAIIIIVSSAIVGLVLINEQTSKERLELGETYNPTINPEDFVTEINNKYFTLVPGTCFVYQSTTEEGIERIEDCVTNQSREILGVSAVVVWDRVWFNDELIEETYDWYAQDKDGNVWYLGEDSKEYENNIAVSTKGSWEAGINGAKAGIIMLSDPQIGHSYRQEYYKGEAEDMGEVAGLNESVEVPYGSFTNCLKTKDWTPLEPDVVAYKYYCPEVGNTALELETDPDGMVSVELIEIKTE